MDLLPAHAAAHLTRTSRFSSRKHAKHGTSSRGNAPAATAAAYAGNRDHASQGQVRSNWKYATSIAAKMFQVMTQNS